MHQLIAKIAGKTKICPITGKKVPAEGQRGKGLMAKLGGKKKDEFDATFSRVEKKNVASGRTKGKADPQLRALMNKMGPKKFLAKTKKRRKALEKTGALAVTLKKLGMDKEAGARIDKVKGALKRTGKYAKWGGLGMGVYLAIKALEGAGEAKQEATHRGW